jgi:O-acetyl-ADP-ribose deacetylase (regulator of RNase III)
LLEIILPSGQTLQLVQGNITTEQVDAIVNAANEYLQHGGGVAWAILRRGGEVIQQESDAWVKKYGPVSHAEPAYTSGGNLPCRYVIHAVGPVWGDTQRAGAGGDEASPRALSRADAKLTAAVTGSLNVAEELGLESISLPAISTGIFGFPKERAAQVILKSIQAYFGEKPDSSISLVRLVLYDQAMVAVFSKTWHDHFDAKS